MKLTKDVEYLVYLYFFSFIVLAVYGFHRTTMLLRLLASGQKNLTPPKLNQWPKICIQLPVYNEPRVINRLLESVNQLDYPDKSLVEVQVLDDSTDQTSQLVDQFIATQKLNFKFTVIRRIIRQHYKAGALAAGLKKTDAELLPVFDADFTPDHDFLLKTIPYFADDQIAFVQARWGYVNREQNILTRAQAILIDAHFMIEHPLRFLTQTFNFNGTAGIWRKSAIQSAGGWQGDTVTEDLDLSYRTYLAGWKSIFLKDVVCKSELPGDLAAFKSQQFRWMKGSAQVFKKLIIPIFRSQLPLIRKTEAFFHLSANICYILMLVTGLLSVPAAMIRLQTDLDIGLWLEFILFCCTFGSVLSFYTAGQTLQSESERRVADVVYGIVLGIGLSAHCAWASLNGLFSKNSVFIRTPKKGAINVNVQVTGKAWQQLVFKNFKELIIFSYLFCCVTYLLIYEFYLLIPFVALFASGYAMVAYSALKSDSEET